jgi:hypothetical protein
VAASTLSADRGQLGLAALCTTLRAVDAVIVGGKPVVRGDGYEAAVRALLDGLAQAVAREAGTAQAG